MSKYNMRSKYMIKFYTRCAILLGVFAMYFFGYKGTDVLYGWNFFHEFSLLHILWLLWVIDMVQQLIPAKGVLSLGSQKQFLLHFVPSNLKKTKEELKQFVAEQNFIIIKVAVVWVALILAIGLLFIFDILEPKYCLMFVVFFYVADLICVLFWCPFRVFLMKNRCCATCRIFNWDHLMMFSPAVFCMGFYTWSLFILSVAVFVVWEIYFFTHPERFWEETNEALKCANCKEFLCGRNLHYVGMTNIEDAAIKKAVVIKDEISEKVGETATNIKEEISEKIDEIKKK